MATTQLEKVLSRLGKTRQLSGLLSGRTVLRDPMEMILFENVAYLVGDEQHWAAFEALRNETGSDPAKLLSVADSILLRIVRPSGHARMLIGKLREVALVAMQEFEGDLGSVFRMPPLLAKRRLMKFPGIGEPGAEKILLFSGALPILALDSNALRVLLRLGYGKEQKSYKTTYKCVQEAAAAEIEPNAEKLVHAHLLLKEHGKTLCRRTNPLCDTCPVSKLCRYYAEQVGQK